MCSPRRTARSRSAALCAPDPVRWASRLPNCSGATARSSTVIPLCVRARAAPALERDTLSICSSVPTWSISAGSSSTMSRSLTLSRRRRAEPASSTRAPGSIARSASINSSPTASARSSTTRRDGRSAAPASSAASTDSSNLAPNPLRVLSRCACAASRSACGESIASSSKSRRARLGPSPGRPVIASRPGGNRSRSFTAAGMSPVSSSARIFSSSVAPIPASSVTRPSRVSAATDTGASRIALAALR